MKINQKDKMVLVAATVLAVFSLSTRDNTAQVIWYIVFMVVEIGTRYELPKLLSAGKWEYITVAAFSVLSLLLGWNEITHGRWFATPIVNLYVPGLFPLEIPLVMRFKEKRRPMPA